MPYEIIMSDKFIDHLMEIKIIPKDCSWFQLTCQAGEVAKLEYKIYGDTKLYKIKWKEYFEEYKE